MSHIDTIYDDEDIIVINKPPGLLSVPGRSEPDSALFRLQQEHPVILVIHRLDMDTSGLLVFAKNKAAQVNIQQQFEKQLARKRYEAVVTGKITASHGCINLPIIVDWPNRPLQKISHTEGRYALTRWQKLAVEDGNTRVKLMPATGRSHQLRIHCQQLGHAIVGDTLYARNQYADSHSHVPSRLYLHARELTIRHPRSQQLIELKCPTPF